MIVAEERYATFRREHLKEIFEQPESLANTLRGRLDTRDGSIVLGGLDNYMRDLARAKRIIFTAQGTAWHAGLVGEYLFEDIAKIPCETEYASEFRYRNPLIEDGTVIVAVSQSGETIDTLEALRASRDAMVATRGLWLWGWSTWWVRPSPGRVTPGCTCTAGRRSA